MSATQPFLVDANQTRTSARRSIMLRERRRTFPRGDHGDFWEPQVIADGDSELSEGSLDDGEVVAAGERLALLEGDAAGDVNVEEVDLQYQP